MGSASTLPSRSTHTNDILAGLPGTYTAVRVSEIAIHPRTSVSTSQKTLERTVAPAVVGAGRAGSNGAALMLAL